MIVDDDEEDVELFCEALKEIDHDVECISASNGEDALFKLTKEESPLPDYIFLDLNMPRLNGKQCLKRLKIHSKLRDIPVIIYTTSKLKEDMEETRHLGAVHFLTKPNKLNDLRKAITYILDGKYNPVGQSSTSETQGPSK
jgi:CheY-like chemotaxis protein